jgi:hypothetical protein
VWKGLSLLAANELGGVVKRNVVAVVFYAVASAFVVMGMIFLLLSLQIWLTLYMTEIEANLLIGSTLLFIALVIASVGYAMKRQRKSASAIASTALIALPLAAQLVPTRVRMGTMALFAVMATAVVLGRQAGK